MDFVRYQSVIFTLVYGYPSCGQFSGAFVRHQSRLARLRVARHVALPGHRVLMDLHRGLIERSLNFARTWSTVRSSPTASPMYKSDDISPSSTPSTVAVARNRWFESTPTSSRVARLRSLLFSARPAQRTVLPDGTPFRQTASSLEQTLPLYKHQVRSHQPGRCGRELCADDKYRLRRLSAPIPIVDACLKARPRTEHRRVPRAIVVYR